MALKRSEINDVETRASPIHTIAPRVDAQQWAQYLATEDCN